MYDRKFIHKAWKEMFSRFLYHTLDHLGYKDEMIKFRRESCKSRDGLHNSANSMLRAITAGSKAEGITSMYESDTDTIFLLQKCLCINTVDQLPTQLPSNTIVFLADMVNVPAGYTKLKLYIPSSPGEVRDPSIRECLFEQENGEIYLSSTFWTTMVKETVLFIGDSCDNITGPALPFSLGNMDFDSVAGFSFHCPKLLQTWALRPRQHEWPSRDTIRAACSFLPQVVPVGAKGSDKQFQEWRFCFIESELTLTHSLNETQIKLYIVLKMITKAILKQVTGEISSYIMKNITYWLSESLPLHVFREEKLVSLVLLALKFLRKAITEWKNLPYYMIPSRNLLSERLDDRTCMKLSDILERLVKEGPELFLRVDKLRRGLMIACETPGISVRYGQQRDQLEKNMLELLILCALEKNGTCICIDRSTKDSLLLSIRGLVVSHMCTLYPRRCGVFDSDEVQKTMVDMLS